MISIVNSILMYPNVQRFLYYKENLERHPAFCGRLFAGSRTPRLCTELDARPVSKLDGIHGYAYVSTRSRLCCFHHLRSRQRERELDHTKDSGRRRASAPEEESQSSFSTLWMDTHDVDCDCPSCQRVKERLRRGLERLAWTVPGFRRLAKALARLQRGRLFLGLPAAPLVTFAPRHPGIPQAVVDLLPVLHGLPRSWHSTFSLTVKCSVPCAGMDPYSVSGAFRTGGNVASCTTRTRISLRSTPWGA